MALVGEPMVASGYAVDRAEFTKPCKIYNVDPQLADTMTAVLSRWGNSLAVRIPASMAEEAHFCEGDKLDIRVSRRGRITLEAKPKELDFGALYDAITPENRVDEVPTGPTLGQEVVTW